MANPQKENGFTAIANEVLEQLVKLRIPPSEKDILMLVIRKTYGYQKKQDRISLTQFELGTGLSRVTVVKALKNLSARGLLVKSGLLLGFNKNYETWGVVKAGILVKSSNIFGKGGYTKTSKGGYTYKRKKEMTKEISKTKVLQSGEWNNLIDGFKEINPFYEEFYKNKTERKALEDMASKIGYEKLLATIQHLPEITAKAYAPRITKPTELKRDFGKLITFYKQGQDKKKLIIV